MRTAMPAPIFANQPNAGNRQACSVCKLLRNGGMDKPIPCNIGPPAENIGPQNLVILRFFVIPSAAEGSSRYRRS